MIVLIIYYEEQRIGNMQNTESTMHTSVGTLLRSTSALSSTDFTVVVVPHPMGPVPSFFVVLVAVAGVVAVAPRADVAEVVGGNARA